MNDHTASLSTLVACTLAAGLTSTASAASPPHAPLPADAVFEAVSPLFHNLVTDLPAPRLVLDAAGVAHVLYYDTVSTPQADLVQFALRYAYLDGTVLRSIRIPATGFFTTACVMQATSFCQPRLAAPEIIMDSQLRAQIITQASTTYDHVSNTSTAQIVSITCPPGAACNAPVQIATFQGLCDTGLPRGPCPPPPPKAELAVFGDELRLQYSTSVNRYAESATVHWVVATRPGSSSTWTTSFQYDATVTDTLP